MTKLTHEDKPNEDLGVPEFNLYSSGVSDEWVWSGTNYEDPPGA